MQHLNYVVLLVGIMIILINVIIILSNNDCIFKSFIEGFWTNNLKEDNEVILYMDIETKAANMIISKNGEIILDDSYTYSITPIWADNINSTIYNLDLRKYNIKFKLEDESKKNEYNEKFLDKVLTLHVSIQRGLILLEGDNYNMTLFKDNILNNRLVEYIYKRE